VAGNLHSAYARLRDQLLAERTATGHWVGELSTSALSTATAVSALSIVLRSAKETAFAEHKPTEISAAIGQGIQYLVTHQNDDGGWGDTELSYSNIATTLLGIAAIHLADAATEYAEVLQKANAYVDQHDRFGGLRKRYGVDKTFVVPILSNLALAGLAEWKDVAALPFELACVPQDWYRFVGMPVVSYAIPALVAIGQARYFHKPPWNPLTRVVRKFAVNPSLNVLERMQPASGGYLEAVPLTSFVVMSLAATGRETHAVTQAGVRFLLESRRPDGSWPIDTNLATWVTTLSLNALFSAGEELPADILRPELLDWLIACQHRQRHPFTGASPGGWGWSDLSGAVPDADDTPGALLTLAHWHNASACSAADRERILEAGQLGLNWLLRLQNRDDGWPTFCKGWGKLPFDRSGTDLTAHVLRAIHAWQPLLTAAEANLSQRLEQAKKRGFSYLTRTQHADGSWSPLWFGNQERADEDNPLYGTAKVLYAYRDLQRLDDPAAERASSYLLSQQNADGGWGGDSRGLPVGSAVKSSVEETSLVLEALLSRVADSKSAATVEKALFWLTAQIEGGTINQPAPIGFYFAKLWYYETLFSLVFATSALGRAVAGSRGE